MIPTFGYGKQQPVVQTIAQYLSQHWKTPAALAGSGSSLSNAIRTVLILNENHGSSTGSTGEELEAGMD
jgi:hypothetical protein